MKTRGGGREIKESRGPGPTSYFHLFLRLDEVFLAVIGSTRIYNLTKHFITSLSAAWSFKRNRVSVIDISIPS